LDFKPVFFVISYNSDVQNSVRRKFISETATMSEDEPVSRKEKKALRDAERHKKDKKRKHEEIAENGNSEEQNEFDKDFLPLESGTVGKKAGGIKQKSSKSSSRKHKASDVVESAQSNQQKSDTQAISTKPPKRKKTKHDAVESDVPKQDSEAPATSTEPLKRKKTKKDGVENDTLNQDTTKPQKRKKTTQGGTADEASKHDATPSDKAHRFILFVGNLPYGATDATVRSHFKKLEPFTLRHRTDPKTGKSKGFAFLEFENYDRMKTCLKLYHHSMFDPDKVETEAPEDGEGDQENARQKAKPAKTKKASKGVRRINVELTAGGGGKAEGRKEKIRVKNERLGEQRQRRAEAEKKDREKKAKEDGEANATKPVKKAKKAEKIETKSGAEGMTDVHPSRLARITA
jgi:nucleolar protein 6